MGTYRFVCELYGVGRRMEKRKRDKEGGVSHCADLNKIYKERGTQVVAADLKDYTSNVFK